MKYLIPWSCLQVLHSDIEAHEGQVCNLAEKVMQLKEPKVMTLTADLTDRYNKLVAASEVRTCTCIFSSADVSPSAELIRSLFVTCPSVQNTCGTLLCEFRDLLGLAILCKGVW